MHAHTLIELKKNNESYKIVRFCKGFEKHFLASSREFALYFLVSLFSCFDHFMGVFDYSVGRSMLSCFHVIMEFMDSDEELFLAEKLFFHKKYNT